MKFFVVTVHVWQISVEDVKERQDRLAKMRNLLFRHELKSKRIKHIKSKTYRRLLKKDKSKAAATEIEMNPEAAKELAEKQEFKRAEVISNKFQSTPFPVKEQINCYLNLLLSV